MSDTPAPPTTRQGWWALLCPMRSIDELTPESQEIVREQALLALERHKYACLSGDWREVNDTDHPFELPQFGGLSCEISVGCLVSRGDRAVRDGWACELEFWQHSRGPATKHGQFSFGSCLHQITILDERIVPEMPGSESPYTPWSARALTALRGGEYQRAA